MQSTLFIALISALLVPSFQQAVNQNSPPVFASDLSELLVEEGIYENTTAGTVLGRLSCTDPDGDTIAYFVSKSKSIIVSYVTGEVTLIRPLDREQSVNSLNPDEKPNSVTFACVDINANGFQISAERTTVDLIITVRDNNDNFPVFSSDSVEGFTFNIKESDPPGTVLTPVMSLTDEDRGINAKLLSLDFICSEDDIEPCQKFRLNYTEVTEGVYRANIILQKTLDFEQRVDYRSEVRAVDGVNTNVHNTASIGVRILVEDSQDVNPFFTNSDFNFEISEGLGVGTQINFAVSAQDGDSGQRAVVLEILENPNGINLFQVGNTTLADPSHGHGIYKAPIIVISEVDREVPELAFEYSFTAKATELESDGSRTSATATAVFKVTIQDLNDNFPRFSESTYSVMVAEIEQIGAGETVQVPDTRIEVDDFDEPRNAQYQLEIVSQSYRGTFDFTPKGIVTGQQFFYLTISDFQYMDYEVPEYRSQVIVLRAVEMLNGQRGTESSTATVSVTLTDINDNSPIFDRPEYKGSVAENAANFTSIVTVKASDKDSGVNGQFEYSLGLLDSSKFYINPSTGEIRLTGRLDFERRTEYSFLAYATDKASSARSSAALVRIQVIDFNDVGPQFTPSVYTTTVSEGRTTFESPVTVFAFDPADQTAQITYRIVSGNTQTNSFLLDPNTGELSLREALDFDRTPNRTGIYVLNIEASDNGNPPQVTRSSITVTVLDENNNFPVFTPTQYFATLSEVVSAGTFVLKVTASDADFGSNGEITYRLGGGGRDNFVVDRQGSVYVSNTPGFDYDLFKQLTVKVIAIDGGSPQRSATATMSITITDTNNKRPQFDLPLYTAIVDESVPAGTSVVQVSATDQDSAYTLQYSILTNTVTALNSAGAQLGSIFPYDFRKLFVIDPVSGLISVSQVGPGLDRDKAVEVSFQVLVQDVDSTAIGQQNDTCRVTITISGTPNKELYFILPWTKDNPIYELPILESSPVGTEIMTLQARDLAENDNVLTTYEEVPNTDSGNFFNIVSKTDSRGTVPGVVLLNQPLDFESGQLRHSVVVRAVKSSISETRTVTATIVIRIQDFNDNVPEFTQASYRFSIQESAITSYQVGVIAAVDRDGASFSPIEFQLGGGLGRDDFQLFQPDLDDGTALLLVNKPLDYERRSLYTIDVLATDNLYGRGSAIRLQTKATVIIQVLDENDNTPTFSDARRSYSVPETAPTGTRLGQILAADEDFGLNGQVFYRLEQDKGSASSETALQLFSLTGESSLLATKASLRGLSGVYSMLVVARDRGSPTLSSSVRVTVKVQGSEDDDGTPQWLSPLVNNFVVYVTEHNKTKLDVAIRAAARTQGASITYSLSPYRDDYRNFLMNATTGDIFVIADLDREIQPTYTLVMQATDTIGKQVSKHTLLVSLIDIDDNVPSFQKSVYASCPIDFEMPTVFTAADNTPAGTIVGQAVACDPDGPGNNVMYYYLYTGRNTGNNLCQDNDSGAFRVFVNGSIETTIMLDHEQKQEYLVCVEVQTTVPGGRRKRAFNPRDMVNPDRIGYIVIKVTDSNDNGPVFPDDTATAVIDTIPAEATVIQVQAIDPDGPLNNRVEYRVSNITYHPSNDRPPFSLRGAFILDPIYGVITTNLPSYESFAQGYFLLDIKAFDVKNSLFNDSMTVKIFVHQRTQAIRVVLDRVPAEGQMIARDLIRELNEIGQPTEEFYFKTVSEHRTGSRVVETWTDVCFVVVENNKVVRAGTAIDVLDSAPYRNVLRNVGMVDRGTCYQMLSTEDKVKWRDLWWLLVVIAIFIFICIIILLVTITILYDRYKSYMDTHKTYLVPQ